MRLDIPTPRVVFVAGGKRVRVCHTVRRLVVGPKHLGDRHLGRGLVVGPKHLGDRHLGRGCKVEQSLEEKCSDHTCSAAGGLPEVLVRVSRTYAPRYELMLDHEHFVYKHRKKPSE